METKLKLRSKITNILSILPETGMGYQAVDVYLKGGKVLHNRIVLNSTYLQLKNNEQISLSQIKEVSLSE